MAQALRQDTREVVQQAIGGQQLALHEGWMRTLRARRQREARTETVLCAGCREKEARYGFADPREGEPATERPRTLCFECFRVEIGRRQAVAEQLRRGWNAEQARLPLDETLRTLTRRRRRAQIAARHALGA